MIDLDDPAAFLDHDLHSHRSGGGPHSPHEPRCHPGRLSTTQPLVTNTTLTDRRNPQLTGPLASTPPHVARVRSGPVGQVDGRTSAAVQAWLAARTRAFRAGVEVVVIDPHAGYAAAVRQALPDAVIAVDHFHLIMLANKAVTAVRQRVTRDLFDRRGHKTDPTWANRRLLLRGRERLSQAGLARMWNGCVDYDPTGQILTAWIAKEELRALCSTAARGGHHHEIRQRLWAFYRWCADARHPRADHAGRDDRDLVAGHRGRS